MENDYFPLLLLLLQPFVLMFYRTAWGAIAINAEHESEQELRYENISLTVSPEDIQSNLEKHVADVRTRLTGKLN